MLFKKKKTNWKSRAILSKRYSLEIDSSRHTTVTGRSSCVLSYMGFKTGKSTREWLYIIESKSCNGEALYNVSIYCIIYTQILCIIPLANLISENHSNGLLVWNVINSNLLEFLKQFGFKILYDYKLHFDNNFILFVLKMFKISSWCCFILLRWTNSSCIINFFFFFFFILL